MQNLINTIKSIIDENNKLTAFFKRYQELIEDSGVEEINKATREFYSFMNKYVELNNTFKSLMDGLGFKTIKDIPDSSYCSGDELEKLLNTFDHSVRDTQEKMKALAKIISGELNMINKIKVFRSGSSLDLKL